MTLFLKMFVKSLPENETFLSATLILALGSHRQWIVPVSLQAPLLRRRDILFPSLGAAKLPTKELRKLLLPKALSL